MAKRSQESLMRRKAYMRNLYKSTKRVPMSQEEITQNMVHWAFVAPIKKCRCKTCIRRRAYHKMWRTRKLANIKDKPL